MRTAASRKALGAGAYGERVAEEHLAAQGMTFQGRVLTPCDPR
ncbi:MAG: hypothetical protein WB767_02600 [Nocardioides sp.]